jgi:hypothetical protein
VNDAVYHRPPGATTPSRSRLALPVCKTSRSGPTPCAGRPRPDLCARASERGARPSARRIPAGATRSSRIALLIAPSRFWGCDSSPVWKPLGRAHRLEILYMTSWKIAHAVRNGCASERADDGKSCARRKWCEQPVTRQQRMRICVCTKLCCAQPIRCIRCAISQKCDRGTLVAGGFGGANARGRKGKCNGTREATL